MACKRSGVRLPLAPPSSEAYCNLAAQDLVTFLVATGTAPSSVPPVRRGQGEGSVHFEHQGPCRDPGDHRHCPGRWRGVVSLGFGPGGKRLRRAVSGRTKTEAREKIRALREEV